MGGLMTVLCIDVFAFPIVTAIRWNEINCSTKWKFFVCAYGLLFLAMTFECFVKGGSVFTKWGMLF